VTSSRWLVGVTSATAGSAPAAATIPTFQWQGSTVHEAQRAEYRGAGADLYVRRDRGQRDCGAQRESGATRAGLGGQGANGKGWGEQKIEEAGKAKPNRGNGIYVSNLASFLRSTNDNYSRGTALADADIKTIVTSAINSGLPLDANGVYFVLTSADVNETSGFCTRYCGWHTHGTINGADIKYSFVGNPDRCPSACEQQTTGPNGNAGADGMASIISHEFEESTSDPDLNAWHDSRGAENADKCAWTFGTTYTTPNGAQANMKLGARDFLIQRNWVNASGGFCAVKYP